MLYFALGNNGAQPCSGEEIQKFPLKAGYISLKDLQLCKDVFHLPDPLIRECQKKHSHFRNSFEVYDDYSFGFLSILDILHVKNPRDQVAFILKKDVFLMICIEDADGSTEALFRRSLERLHGPVTLEKAVSSFLETLTEDGGLVLEQAEPQILQIEQELLENRAGASINRKIFQIKSNLMIRRNYYEALIEIGSSLQENENAIFEGDTLRYFKIFTDHTARLSANTQFLCENLVHLQEAYEASLELNLNRIMKFFTVITTIFLPLTLIVGWYGMNFPNMPEFRWAYGYPAVICFSGLVVALCFWFFKKKRLL